MGAIERRIVARWLSTKIRTARQAPKEKKLYIFDFDGTLHRSPAPPADREDQESWWSDPSSLEPPSVPEETDPSMWRRESVDAMRRALQEDDAYVVVMTGRHESLQDRIAELLDEAGIVPDELITNPEKGNTQRYKRDEMLYLLKQLPNVREVEFWEDRKDDLKGYQRAAEAAGVRFVPREVNDYSQENPVYLGVFLTPESRRELLEKFPPKHESVRADHVTLKFKPSDEDMAKFLEKNRLGEEVDVEVVGYADDEKGQVVQVKLPEKLSGMDDRTPHVTVSVSPGTEAVYSNELLERDVRPVPPMKLRGYVDGGPRVHHEEPEARDAEQKEPERWKTFLSEKTRNPEYGKPGHSREYVQRRTLYQRGGPARAQVMREWARQRR